MTTNLPGFISRSPRVLDDAAAQATTTNSKNTRTNNTKRVRFGDSKKNKRVSSYVILIGIGMVVFGVTFSVTLVQDTRTAVPLGAKDHPLLGSFVDRSSTSTQNINLETAAVSLSRNTHTHDANNNTPEEAGSHTASTHTPLNGLSCTPYYNEPSKSESEMVYWSDIPTDSGYRSPFHDSDDGDEQYMTFEPDRGGWNNIRMAMETVLVMAHATGRTLVLPPEAEMYLLKKKGGKHKTEFGFNDFFHLDRLDKEHEGMKIITMETFLKRMAVTGKLGAVTLPDNSRIDWNGRMLEPLWQYLRNVGHIRANWNPNECVAAFPSSRGSDAVERMAQLFDNMASESNTGGRSLPKNEDYHGKPVPVDGSTEERLRELLDKRNGLCIYDVEMQSVPLIHFQAKHRLLTHFYSFVFFEDWKQDVWTKRFVRDHVRYIDEIQCAAAQVVAAVRERARKRDPMRNADGFYDSMHIRRGDFQYKKTRLPAEQLYDNSKDQLTPGSTVFIATDERNKKFFDPLGKHYDLCYLDDFAHLLEGINTNYYGMLDQLIASKGRVFFGTWFSTFSGYINRMRGYYTTKKKIGEYQDGLMTSWYFYPPDRKFEMVQYKSVRLPIYMREFPTAWRDIDKDVPIGDAL